MIFKVLNYEILPRDEFDGRKFLYYFQLIDQNNISYNKVLSVFISGSILPAWIEHIKIEQLNDENICKHVFSILKEDLIQYLQSVNIDSFETVSLKYLMQNSPNLNVEFLGDFNLGDLKIVF